MASTSMSPTVRWKSSTKIAGLARRLEFFEDPRGLKTSFAADPSVHSHRRWYREYGEPGGVGVQVDFSGPKFTKKIANHLFSIK